MHTTRIAQRVALTSLAVALLGAGTALAETPQIVQALKSGDRTAVLGLAKQKTQANAAEPDGTTALHWAVRQDDLELVDRLLRSGANPKASNRYGVTPLHLAAVNGNAAVIERLLKAGADANETGVDGETALMTVARGGHVGAAKTLLAQGATVDARERWHGQTALMWAAAQGHVDMLRVLLANGADVNASSSVDQWERQVTSEPRDKWLPPGGITPLMFAARENCVACIPVLIEAGADKNATTPDGISSTLLALINGHYDAAGALVDAGVDPNLYDYTGRGALYAAIDFNTMPASNRPAPKVIENKLTALDVARKLLDHGADPNARVKRQVPYRAKLDRGNDTMLGAGTTPFLRAAKAADLPAMRLLLERGADPTLPVTRSGINPLMAAAGLGTNEADTTGRYKTQAQASEAIALLLDRQLDVNARATDGRTALHGAALQGYDDVIKFLVSKGADLDAKDCRGFTPLDMATGKAGGFGFAGQEGVARESTAAVLKELSATTKPTLRAVAAFDCPAPPARGQRRPAAGGDTADN
jgi:ankyrin repeat protein